MEPRLLDGDVLPLELGCQREVHRKFDEGVAERDVDLAAFKIFGRDIRFLAVFYSFVPPQQVCRSKALRLVGRDGKLHAGSILLSLKVRRISIYPDFVGRLAPEHLSVCGPVV